MGTSNWQSLPYAIENIRAMNPKSILDIGVGYGRWGIICREFLEVWNGKIFCDQWEIKIDGIEAFPKSIDEYHNYFYNKIYLTDAFHLVTDENFKNRYDLIILGDVLEHFDKDSGNQLLKRCLEIGSYVLLNIPIGEDWDQDTLYENEYERHLSSWSEEELELYPVIKKYKMLDYINRPYASYIFSNETNPFKNQLLNPFALTMEKDRISKEVEIQTLNKQWIEEQLLKVSRDIKNELSKNEKRIEQADDKSEIEITISSKNLQSNGFECWVYDISTDRINHKDFNQIKKNRNWHTQASSENIQGHILVGTQQNSDLKFNIIGKELNLKVLTHPWSGIIDIKKNGEIVKTIDLYSKSHVITNYTINLEG